MTDQIQKPSRKKLIIAFAVVIIALLIIFGGIFGFAHMVNSKKEEAIKTWKMQPAEVTATTAKSVNWNPSIKATGQAVAIQSVNVTTQSTGGLIDSISFESGQMVKKGQVLFTLDTSQLKAQLAQAKAQLQLAKITYDRNKELIKQNAVSEQTLDQSKATYDSDLASVQSIEADINFNIIRAPFDGKIGIRQISLGQFFQAGNSAATLTMISPIYINFPVPQNQMDQIHIGGKIKFTSDTYPGKTFEAKITAINSEVSSNNLALNVQATYDNKDEKAMISPGMFLDVSVVLPAMPNTIILPRNAINYTLYGETVAVLNPVMKNGKPVMAEYSAFKDGSVQMVSTGKAQYTVKLQPVQTTATDDNQVIVHKGIKAGQLVATSGQNKLQNDDPAVVNNEFNFKNNP